MRCATASGVAPGTATARPGDDRPEDRPERQAAQELCRRVVVCHAGRPGFGPRTAIDGHDGDPQPGDDRRPEQVVIPERQDADSRAGPKIASPAHAPEDRRRDEQRQPTAGGAADRHRQRRVEDPDQHGQDQ